MWYFSRERVFIVQIFLKDPLWTLTFINNSDELQLKYIKQNNINFTLEQDMKAQSGIGFVALLFL